MNMWALTPEFVDLLESGFVEFFEKAAPANPLKAEYLLPIYIDELLHADKVSVKVLPTHDKWFGVGRKFAPGEYAPASALREVREETGLDISAVPAVMRTPIYGYRNEDLKRGDNYFVDIYHVKLEFADADVTIEQSETIDFRMATMDEIRALHEADEFLHYKRIQEALAAER